MQYTSIHQEKLIAVNEGIVGKFNIQIFKLDYGPARKFTVFLKFVHITIICKQYQYTYIYFMMLI